MSRAHDAEPVPDVLLERYRLGEVDVHERERMTLRLAGDESLRLRLEGLERSDAEIRERYPAEWLAERVQERLRPAAGPGSPGRMPGWTAHWPVPAAIAAAAAVLLVLAPRIVGPPPAGPGVRPPLEPAERVKGLRPALALYRKTADGSEALTEGSIARAGDLVRVGYRSAGQPYGVIVSIDGRGAVTLHLPALGRAAAPLRAGGIVLLDHAYELDDAPGWECFYLVTSETPFDVAPVLSAARRVAATAAAGRPPTLPLPATLEQAAFFLRKGERP